MRLLLALLLCFAAFASARAEPLPSLTIDLESGRVLQAERAFDPWHPASLTKMMTAYTTFRAIADGTVQESSPVIISRQATRQPPSKMGYGIGTTLTVKNAVTILLVKSANDVAAALAEGVSGSEQAFVARMNREAQRLGMTGSRFTNPHGLHNAAQVVTARDMALLTRALHRDFPQYANLFAAPSLLAPKKTKSGKVVQRVYFSYNLLLERFKGADGFKTGFVCASGYNFVGSATRNGRRIAAIVLGRDSQTARAVDAARLITQGFEQPYAFGTPIERLRPNGPVAKSPRNMRPVYCTEAARAARYDPGAGQAIVKSRWLLPRTITRGPLVVTLEEPSEAVKRFGRIPLPTFRPQNATFSEEQPKRESVQTTKSAEPAGTRQANQRPVTKPRPIAQSAVGAPQTAEATPQPRRNPERSKAGIDALLQGVTAAPKTTVPAMPQLQIIPTPAFRPAGL